MGKDDLSAVPSSQSAPTTAGGLPRFDMAAAIRIAEGAPESKDPAKMKMATPEMIGANVETPKIIYWALNRWSDKQGSRGISIMRNGVAVANMVGQLDDMEYAYAIQICSAMNGREGAKGGK